MFVRATMNVILVRERARPSIKHRTWTCCHFFPPSLSFLPNPKLSSLISLALLKTGNISCNEINSTLRRIIMVQCAPMIRHGCKGGIPRSAAYHYGAYIHGCQTICQRAKRATMATATATANGRDGTTRLTPNHGPRWLPHCVPLIRGRYGARARKGSGIIGRDYAKRVASYVYFIRGTRARVPHVAQKVRE